MNPELWTLLKAAAKSFGMDPFLLAAQVLQESAGDSTATRYEPGYRWTWPPPKSKLLPRIIYPIAPCSKDTEAVMQRVSWGLLQVMGALARELGYRRPFLSGLAGDADTALELGCLWMRKKLDAYATVEQALSAFNAGSPTLANQANYVRPIIAKAEALRREIPTTA